MRSCSQVSYFDDGRYNLLLGPQGQDHSENTILRVFRDVKIVGLDFTKDGAARDIIFFEQPRYVRNVIKQLKNKKISCQSVLCLLKKKKKTGIEMKNTQKNNGLLPV